LNKILIPALLIAVLALGITNVRAQFYDSNSDESSDAGDSIMEDTNNVGDSIMEDTNKTIAEINRLTGFTDNEGSTDDGNDAQIVLLSQKLKKSNYGYRDLVGQVKNIGNGTANYIQIG
jgi:hypothetical protein